MRLALRQPQSSLFSVSILAIWTLTFCSRALADQTRWVPYTTDEGTVYFDDNRQPALYTGDFGDCQGNSLIDVTRFDASLYRDNLTVMFHMAGSTALTNERVMMYFSVYAYGENRFNLTFNPCTINIPSLCPLNASDPVEANGLIPIGATDLAGIPPIAFSIPDFEGQAILRLFSNKTKTQIACYSAVMRNGNSFSHPAAVGSILGLFVALAFFSSLAVTIYGQIVPETRIHYAHSMSVFVVFSVLQHVFFTGSLSMNWPSVLVAFWSNYGWSAGMIYSQKMQASINHFIGNDRGNISMVGSAPTNQDFDNLGGGVALSQIFTRSTQPNALNSFAVSTEHMLRRRSLPNITTGFDWYGYPVAPGLPLPGNYSGFAGTLAELNIPASNALLTGLLWFLILVVIVAAAVIALKWILELLAVCRLLRTSRTDVFRSHWIRFAGAAVFRTCFIAFFMLVYLALFQFALGGGKNVITLAAVLLAVVLFGMFGAALYALWCRLYQSKFKVDADKLQVVAKKHGKLTWYGVTRESSEKTGVQPTRVVKNLSWWQPHFVDTEEIPHVHDNKTYIFRFGWLSSRFRRSKWWFFSAWLGYELVRACFYGGAAGRPLIQVFGLLVWEIIAFIVTVIAKPFESSRLNLFMVYFLGFSKVATVALSSAFDPRFGLNRIMTTVIGVVIIVIQGVLTVCLMAAILVGTVSSYISMTRNHESINPEALTNVRIRYLAHIDQKATDKPRPPPTPPPPEPETPKEPYFNISSVRREPKIEEEDPESTVVEETSEFEALPDQRTPRSRPLSQANSVKSSTSNLPFGAKIHRRSWSVKELNDPSVEQLPSNLHSRMSVENIREVPVRYRASSLREMSTDDVSGLYGTDWQASRHGRVRSASNLVRVHKTRRSIRDVSEVPSIESHEAQLDTNTASSS